MQKLTRRSGPSTHSRRGRRVLDLIAPFKERYAVFRLLQTGTDHAKRMSDTFDSMAAVADAIHPGLGPESSTAPQTGASFSHGCILAWAQMNLEPFQGFLCATMRLNEDADGCLRLKRVKNCYLRGKTFILAVGRLRFGQ